MIGGLSVQVVPWFGPLPVGWAVKRLKDVARIKGGSTPSAVEIGGAEEIPWATPTDFEDMCRDLGDTARKISRAGLKEIGNKVARAGSVILSCRAPAGKVALISAPMAYNQGVKNLEWRGAGMLPAFLYYLLIAMRPAIEDEARGATFQEISAANLGRLLIPVPPSNEQTRIATYLDGACSTFDRALRVSEAKKHALLELKAAIRERLTLKGLDPSASSGRSDFEWHGVVPKHWRVERIGNVYREAADHGHGDLPVLSVSIHSGISDRELADHESGRKVNRSEDRGLYKRVKPGDLVYNQMRAWQGGFGVAKVHGLVSPAYVVARPKVPVESRFLEHLLRALPATEEMRRRSRGIIDFRLRLYWDEFKDICVALPPLDEQVEIANEIDRRLSEIDHQVELLDQSMALLREAKRSVIVEAVCGAMK